MVYYMTYIVVLEKKLLQRGWYGSLQPLYKGNSVVEDVRLQERTQLNTVTMAILILA